MMPDHTAAGDTARYSRPRSDRDPIVSRVKGETHKLFHRHAVIIADGILPQEVQLHNMLLAIHLSVQPDMLHTERAAAHGVSCLPLFLLISCSQCQLDQGRHQSRLRSVT